MSERASRSAFAFCLNNLKKESFTKKSFIGNWNFIKIISNSKKYWSEYSDVAHPALVVQTLAGLAKLSIVSSFLL